MSDGGNVLVLLMFRLAAALQVQIAVVQLDYKSHVESVGLTEKLSVVVGVPISALLGEDHLLLILLAFLL